MSPIGLQSIVFISSHMFITTDELRSPLSAMLAGSGKSYWTSVELALNHMWFVMAIAEIDKSEVEQYEINRAEPVNVDEGTWRVFPKDAIASLPDLRRGVAVNRNRDVNWTRLMDKSSSVRRIPIWVQLNETEDGFVLEVTDQDGNIGTARIATAKTIANTPSQSTQNLRVNITKFGNTIFELAGALDEITLNIKQPWFIPASLINSMRREAIENLEARTRFYQQFGTSPAQPWPP